MLRKNDLQKTGASAVGALLGLVMIAFAALTSVEACGQAQVLVETPFQQNSNSFYENFGVGWNYTNGNFSINVPNGVRPPFGMGDPNADAQLNFSGSGPGGGRFGLNFTLGQGSNRTNSVTSPMIMLPNGGTGAIFDGSIRPFVTGFIPVVGEGGFAPGYAPAPVQWISPVQQKLQQMAAEGTLDQLGKTGTTTSVSETAPGMAVEPSRAKGHKVRSSAERADMSVAEIRRQQKQDANAAHLAAGRKAAELEADGKLVSAKLQYKRAAELAPKDQRSQWVADFDRVSRVIRAARQK